MNAITQTQKDRDIRRVYIAIDAVQNLCDAGHADSNTDRVFSALREMERRIESLPVRTRKPGHR